MSAEGGGAAASGGQQHLLMMPAHARYPSRLTIDMDSSGSPKSNARSATMPIIAAKIAFNSDYVAKKMLDLTEDHPRVDIVTRRKTAFL